MSAVLFGPEQIPLPIEFFDRAPAFTPAPMPQARPAEEPFERALRRVIDVLLDGHPAVVAFSSGKDSTTLACVVMNAARQVVECDLPCPPIVVLHGNTGVEQPEIVALAKSEIEKMRAYAKRHSIPFEARIRSPTLNSSFPVRVIGGRALPSFPNSRSDCTTDWKISVNQRAQREVFASLQGAGKWAKPVVMTGVRMDESTVRDQRIAKRGEVAEGIWENEFGALRLSPILDFTSDDVWEVIGLAHAGAIDSYSDFSDTMRIYRDAGGSSCVVVADMKSAGNSKPCGTRTGCWACTRVGEDKSMGQMIESDPGRYGYLKPLAQLRNFISRTQYDWSLRTFVGRTIDAEGFIAIGADTYSPDMLQRLLRYTLSAQIASGVEIISAAQMVAIDARWSQYAIAPPFTALKIYLEVMGGKLEFAPDVQRHAPSPVPKLGRIHVGHPTYNDAQRGNVSGLRNVGAEMFHESCGFELKALKDGTLVLDTEEEVDFTVDEEGACDFLEFIAPEMIADYCRHDCSDWTWGFKTYLQYGTLNIAKGKSAQTHEILQRSQWRQANNLHGQQEPTELAKRCADLSQAACLKQA